MQNWFIRRNFHDKNQEQLLAVQKNICYKNLYIKAWFLLLNCHGKIQDRLFTECIFKKQVLSVITYL